MASNNNAVEETSIWGDIVVEPTRPKMSFAEKLKRSDAKMSPGDLAARGARFETTDHINFKEIILHFQEKFKDASAVQQLMPLSSMPGRQKWNIIFSKASMVDNVIDNLIKFPSMTKEEIGIEFTPVRRRALLITIPNATPDISDDEIVDQLSYYGTVLRIWKQTWEGFPHVFNGKRLVTMFPSVEKELPPFVIIKNKKVSLSYKGKPIFCNICMKDNHRTSECPSRDEKHCFLCGAQDHMKSQCEKFEKIKRPRGRIMPGEINDLISEPGNEENNNDDTTADIPEQNPNPVEAHAEEENQDHEPQGFPQGFSQAAIPGLPQRAKRQEKSPKLEQNNSKPANKPEDVEPHPTPEKQPPHPLQKNASDYPPFKKGTKRSIPTTPEKKPRSKKTPGKDNNNLK